MNCFICKIEVEELFKVLCKVNDQDMDVDICSSCYQKIFQEKIKYTSPYSIGCHIGNTTCKLCKEPK